MEIARVQGVQASGAAGLAGAGAGAGAKESFAMLLQERVENLKEDLEEMNARREELDELEKMRQELIGNAGGQGISSLETVKRLMPDGTILVTTSKDGEVVEQYKKKPHMVPVPDGSQPRPPEGSGMAEPTKWVPRQSIMDLLSV